jgi:hypothetical protein
MIHPIFAVIAVGGLIYSLSPLCPPATRWPQRVCYGVMLYLAWWCPWPGWVIFLVGFGCDQVVRLPMRIYEDAKMRRAERAQSHPELPSTTHGSP